MKLLDQPLDPLVFLLNKDNATGAVILIHFIDGNSCLLAIGSMDDIISSISLLFI